MSTAGSPGTTRPLVLLAHGTRARVTTPLLPRIRSRVAGRLPRVDIHHGYVELQEPSAHRVIRDCADPVIVPLFLGSGYHVEQDLPAVLDRHGPGTLTAHLGPHPGVISAVVDRLDRQLGRHGLRWSDLDGIVLAAAGSRRPTPQAEAESAARAVEDLTGLPVRPAYLTAAEPTVGQAVARWRSQGARTIAVASYLLAEGRFSRALHSCGATVVAPPIGDHHALTEVIVHRYEEALAH